MNNNRLKRTVSVLLMALLFLNVSVFRPAWTVFSPLTAQAEETAETGTSDSADDSQDDEEFIPDEYYEPIQSNATQGWPQGEAVQASAGAVYDLDTGTFVYAKNIDRQLFPASITKIMTALLVLENADLNATMTCTDAVYKLDDNASNTGLCEGEQMKVSDALYTLMLESANDAANALAVHVAGSIEDFAKMMNDKAASLGCTGTHFSNPSGLHADDHYTTAHDMALIAAAAYANETFRTLCSTVTFEVGPTNKTADPRDLTNHHRMLQSDSEYYQDWCTGGKTGYTENAWNTLVTYGEKDGKRFVCVLLHGNGADQNYRETADLMNYAFDNFDRVEAGDTVRGGTLAARMHVNYLGKSTELQPEALTQTVAQVSGSPLATVPKGTDVSAVQAAADPDHPGSFRFSYNGWNVGGMSVTASPVSLSLDYPWQNAAAVSYEGQKGDKATEVGQTSDEVWQNVSSFVLRRAAVIRSYVHNNKTTVILTFGLVIVVLLLLLLVLLLRSTGDYRSRKRRKQSQMEADRRAAEIDAKTTAEIEAELRAAMNAEKQTAGEDEDDGEEKDT